MNPGRGFWHMLRVHPSGVLLVTQLVGILALPFIGDSVASRTVYSVFQLVVLTFAILAVRVTSALLWVSLLIGLPTAVFTIMALVLPDVPWVLATGDLLHVALFGYTTYALIRYMFADDIVGRDEMFATGACFTVVAWAFAHLYSAIQIIWGAEQFSSASDGAHSWLELLFLSFTTMTGTGLSDISPVGGHARSAVMLEQLAGVNYLALVVARLLGITLARRGR